MKVADLAGAQLDYWTAKAEGFDAQLLHACGMDYCRVDIPYQDYIHYQPTHNWVEAGRILESRNYTLYPRFSGADSKAVIWLAEAQMTKDFAGMTTDESPLVAVCRLRVHEVFGFEVQA